MYTRRMLEKIRTCASYPLSIFLGAFLLFQIQPMIGHYLLPFFGGAVAVWGTSLVFFTGVLFLGYAYVYFLHKLPMRRQVQIHGVLLAVAVLFIVHSMMHTQSPYSIPGWVFSGTLAPAMQVLLALVCSIGVPYFVLSTTSPLLQQWYGASGKEPYHLYALSNLGSLIALGTYPFLVEPLFRLSTQHTLWAILFLLYSGSCAAVLLVARRAHTIAENFETKATRPAIPTITQCAWLCLSMLPAAMLVATTAHITQTIAPAPFLWVVPLMLYLASLVLAFRGWGGSSMIAITVIVAAVASFSLVDYSVYDTKTELAANVVLFFFGSLYCHAALYRFRPPKENLSYYYLLISLGGLLGTLSMSIVAPLVFKDFFEFVIGIGLFVGAVIVIFPAQKYLRDEYMRWGMVIKIGIIVAIVHLVYTFPMQSDAVHVSRNFYGQVRIRDYEGERWFLHGTTRHGSERLDPARAGQPTTYYVPTSGVARALAHEQTLRGKQGISVGILGLGAGSIAAYCRPNDTYTFYEIDPRVGDVAHTYFTYLKNCAHSSVRYGDGRLLLERELHEGKRGKYDLLVIAAFSDDTVPTHLITKEAMSLYLEHLRGPESVLAIITSTRYVRLTAVTLRIAAELGLPAGYVYDAKGNSPDGLRSDWVLISKDPRTLQAPEIAKAVWEAPRDAPLWTDDYVNLFGALDLPAWYWWNRDIKE